MKKTLLTLIAGVLTAGFASAQCNTDPSLSGEPFGLWPDSLETVYTCTGCGDATRVVQLVTFTDTVIPFEIVPGNPTEVTVYVDAFKILDVRNVPTGMTYGTNVEASADADAQWGYWYNGGDVPNQTSTQGCVYISGSEDQWNALAATENIGTGIGAVQLEIDVDVRVGGSNPDLSTVIAPGTWLSGVPESLGGGAITVDDYWLVAQNSGVGIVEVDDRKFMLVNNYPNPFTGITNISFNAPHDMTGLEFNVYSILGSKVHTAKLDAERGVNNIEFNGSQLSSGLYIYTLSDGVNTLTRKMNVK
ncbi:MAG: T9SS type A sorting domain-containing protein [Flavobacteriales bacterium]